MGHPVEKSYDILHLIGKVWLDVCVRWCIVNSIDWEAGSEGVGALLEMSDRFAMSSRCLTYID